MVLDFKVNRRLVVGMTINFFCPLPGLNIKASILKKEVGINGKPSKICHRIMLLNIKIVILQHYLTKQIMK